MLVAVILKSLAVTIGMLVGLGIPLAVAVWIAYRRSQRPQLRWPL